MRDFLRRSARIPHSFSIRGARLGPAAHAKRGGAASALRHVGRGPPWPRIEGPGPRPIVGRPSPAWPTSAVCAAHSGPSARPVALGPWLRCSLRRRPRPGLAPGSAGRSPSGPPPAPWLRLSGRAAPAASGRSCPPPPSLRLRLRPPAARALGRSGCGRARSVPLRRPLGRCGLPGVALGPPPGSAGLRASASGCPGPPAPPRRGPPPASGLRPAALRLPSGLPPGALAGASARFLRPPAPGVFGVWCSAAAAAAGGSAPRPPSATPGGGGQGSSRATAPPLTRHHRGRQTTDNRCRRRRVPPTPTKTKGWYQKWEIVQIAAGGKMGCATTPMLTI